MKIAFITGIKFKEFEGKYYAVTFSRELIAQRYLPFFDYFTVFADVSPGDAQTPDTMMLSSGNNVTFRFQQSAKRTIDYWLKARSLRKELCQLIDGVDGAIIRLPSTIGLLACEVCRQINKPYLVEAVGDPWDALWNHSWKGKLLAPGIFLRTRHSIRNAPYVVYTSQKFLPGRYPTQGRYTHASNVFLREFDDSILEHRLEKIESMGKSITIGSCGQIDLPFKGHKLVVEAISRLNQQGYDFYYELVGGGDPDYLSAISNRFGMADRVRLLGRKQQQDVMQWLDSIDIYVQPSLTEGMPRALLEAMSRGAPCIGSDAGAIPELLPVRCLFKNNKVNSLVEKLEYALHHLPETAREVFHRSKAYDLENIESHRRRIFEDFRKSLMTYN